jgi:diguanylate cyclase (GGDEF)-like protein
VPDTATPTYTDHPRTIGWVGTSALAMGGSNQMVFLVGALVLAQGTGAIPLLIVGMLLGWAAAPGWIELVLMWPKRVGGIAATCAEAFRPYNPVLANLTGVCYWWGWVPTCGFTAILSATALHEWYLPWVPVTPLAIGVVVAFTLINLAGVRAVTRVAIPVATIAAVLALLSAVIPVVAGTVDYESALSFHLDTPFDGFFGAMTSAMAGLYLVGFAAPAFEAATCHVGETRDPAKNVPRAVYASGAMAGLFFIALPLVWHGTIGSPGMSGELTGTLGPTFAPLLAGGAKAAAIWFMVANMFMGTMQPLAGASRTLSQLSEDGLLPRSWAKRNRNDAPWVTTLLTAGFAIGALLAGVPTWMIAAANFAYLIGIGLPSVAVWLLRRNEPDRERPYRAPRGTIVLGLGAAFCWFVATCLGFEQFGLPTVLLSIVLAYAGSVLYAWRRASDRRRSGVQKIGRSLGFKLTGAMIAVMVLDGAGYLLAVTAVDQADTQLVSLLQDIFVAVAILTISVGLVLPGMISHAVEQVSTAAGRLADGTVADLTRAMEALAAGDFEQAKARVDVVPVDVRTRDEVGVMAASFNRMQLAVGHAAVALDGAREGLAATEAKLERTLAQQTAVAVIGRHALEGEDLRDLVKEAVIAGQAVLGVPLSASIGPAGDGRLIHAGTQSAGGVRIPIGAGRHSVGHLCVDEREGTLSEDDHAFLQALTNVLADAIDRRASEEAMRRQALHDPLTGLPNRTLYIDRLTSAIHQASRRGTSVGVIFLDLDHFKLINDSRGHRAGDELLKAFAVRLSAAVRPGDTVARFGGDEFCVVCADLTDVSGAVAIAQRILLALEPPFMLESGEHFVSASVGIALAEGLDRGAEDLVREADAAMYQAKETGRNHFEVFDEVLRGRATERLLLENDLRRALESDELIAHYQPIVDLATGEIVGVEALARWNHPQRGLVGPGAFIAAGEESGSIVALGDRILRLACAQAARWGAEHGRKLRVSVNLSPRQVARPALAETVAAILEECGLHPSRLVLELTESALIDDSESAARTLHELKALGVHLVLDDFGTGYSSLAYLRRFPIDGLKIDRRFISGIGVGTEDSTIIEAIVNMARGLRINVVAEGVETAAQADFLASIGCPQVQGYLYARPLPPEDCTRLLGTGITALTSASRIRT